MKKWIKVFGSLILSVSFLGTLASCNQDDSNSSEVTCAERVDYCGQLKFNENSGRKYLKTTVHNYRNGDNEEMPNSGCIDGDTVHFNIAKDDTFKDGIIKARFLGVDTPESTGQVQPWGAAAKKFTKDKLGGAKDIIIESESNQWDKDSTNDRYLLYIWYRNSEAEDYRNLNVEIMQEGLAAPKNIMASVYADAFSSAMTQAQKCKLKYWGEEDESFPKGDAVNITIKEIRINLEDYLDKKVRFEGDVTRVVGQTAYVQDWDDEDVCYYGFPVYMGYQVYPIEAGKRISFCGYVQMYNETYQLSGLTYFKMRDHNDNLRVLKDVEIIPNVITVAETKDETKANQLLATYCKVENLTVNSVYTTESDTSASKGAMTLSCTDASGESFEVRTSVLYHEDKTTIYEAADFENKTITCQGIFESYGSSYQLHVFTYDDISFIN